MLVTLKHQAKANELLEKGIQVLWSKGYNGTSVNDLVKAANVPKGSFYFYFESKEDFAVKALRHYAKIMFEDEHKLLDDTSFSPRQRLINLYEQKVKILKEELECKMGCMACNISTEMSEHSEIIRETVVSIQNEVLNKLTQIAEEAQQVGEIAEDVDVKALIGYIYNAAKGAMISMKEVQSSEPIDNFLKITKKLLMQ